eukprot:CAMPEP_0181116832 /NCGR_PEP_ID=MMETSP1071-20121207/22164_1 /TAXON_ID=35127 /ORGANISM="Thalassiosira sp., Strain NH16" /LENGTH=444 /DNA_ID=CAMNT_0023201109 /DNA_START=146 /DNA_END=1480 /DNA_ORIENTATION=+
MKRRRPSMIRAVTGLGAPATQAAGGEAAAIGLSPHLWIDVVRYLTADELKELRLAGSKEIHLADPSLTCHLQLRMDKAPFFSSGSVDNGSFADGQAKKWLTNRRRLVVNDDASSSPRICPRRVAHLVANGFLDTVTHIVIFDCHLHRNIFALLAQLPNLESLTLASHASDQDVGVLDDLESIVANVGEIHTLKHLDIELDCVIHGSRLSFLRRLKYLKHLRLRGFDLSDGISYMRDLNDLTTLDLCHGNFYSSPSNDVNQKELINLMGLTQVQQVHLEGFDSLSEFGLKPFSTAPTSIKRLVLKHCQDMSEECLPSIGRMDQLTSLHMVNSAYDEVPIFDTESLHHLNTLVALKSLSLFYVLEDPSNLKALWGLRDSLETLNIALEDELDEEDVDHLCQHILPMFGSLKKLRIFSEDIMGHYCRHGKLEIEYAAFSFGDLVYLD